MPAGVSALVPLATITLGGTTANLSFTSISGSYRDLILIGANIGLASHQYIGVRFNDVSTSVYNRVFLNSGSGGGIAGTARDLNSSIINIPSTNIVGQSQLRFDIMDYSATDKHKSVLFRFDTAATETVAATGRWASTAVINRVDVLSYGVNFASGTTFSLYGVSA